MMKVMMNNLSVVMNGLPLRKAQVLEKLGVKEVKRIFIHMTSLEDFIEILNIDHLNVGKKQTNDGNKPKPEMKYASSAIPVHRGTAHLYLTPSPPPPLHHQRHLP